ncbi:MAG: 3-deoxy-manno-octulosonate cytidylyltransferase [Fidelibacterota bacterium]
MLRNHRAMSCYGIIPARLGSTRFPEKILADIHGKPMIVRVAEQTQKARKIDRLLVAIDNQKVAAVLDEYNIPWIMTHPQHRSGTDRIYEAARVFSPDIVINIQGDEPLMDPAIIDAMVALFNRPKVEMTTAVSTAFSPGDYVNPHIVKAFLNPADHAIDFVREVNRYEIGGCYKHLGLYGYRWNTLEKFVSLPPGKVEQALRLEQWRALENGITISAVITDYPHHGVDTPDDMEYVLTQWKDLKHYDS